MSDYFTMEGAAKLKGVSYNTVSRAVRKGTLTPTRIGRQALLSREVLEAWKPMKQRAPRKYGQGTPNPDAEPVLMGVQS